MSAKVLVVADDLTGANAAAAGFARAGLRTVTLSHDRSAATLAEFGSHFDVVVVSLDCRHVEPEEARRRAEDAVRAGWPVRLVCNRIDTTLRGNVSATTEAVLRTVAELTGQRTVALCAPAHPAAGRQTVDGMQLLEGRRLEDTELAHDPLNPMHTSDVAGLVSRATGLRTANVPIGTVTAEADELITAMRDGLAHADVVIADALTVNHLGLVARAAVTATGDAVQWVAVDPGPASLELARAAGLLSGHRTPPVLAVSGSATARTREQLRYLIHTRETTVVPLRVRPATRLDVNATAKRLSDALASASGDAVVLLATSIEDEDVVELASTDAANLSADLARTVRMALDATVVAGLFCGGGDLTAELLAVLGAQGMEVETEIVPLVVAGAIVGGPWTGLSVATKGGLVGGPSVVVDCIDHVRMRADAIRHHVPAGETAHIAPLSTPSRSLAPF